MGQYIGARYVPRFMGTYDATQIYEGLDVVDNGMGTSYIAKQPVPAGTSLTNTTYWAVYGSTSGAIINLQNQIDDMKDGTVSGSLQNQIDDLKTGVNNCYVLFDQHTHSFAVTGTDWAEALEALASHVLAFIQGVSDDAYIEMCDLRLTGLGLSFTIPQHKFYDNTATAVTFPFFGMSAAQSSAYIYTGTTWSGNVANNKLVRTWLRDNQYPVSEVVDFTSLVPGPSFNFDMRIWKKISIT